MSNVFIRPSIEEFDEWRAHKLVENFMNPNSIEFYRNMTYDDYCIIKQSEYVQRISDMLPE